MLTHLLFKGAFETVNALMQSAMLVFLEQSPKDKAPSRGEKSRQPLFSSSRNGQELFYKLVFRIYFKNERTVLLSSARHVIAHRLGDFKIRS